MFAFTKIYSIINEKYISKHKGGIKVISFYVYVHDLVQRKVNCLMQHRQEMEILELLRVFGEAQDLVNKVIPFDCSVTEDDDDDILIQTMKMNAREDLLFKIMMPYLAEDMVVAIPISLN